MSDIKKDIVYWVDTGCGKKYLEESAIEAGHSKEDFNTALSEMIASNKITLGVKSQFIVVTEWSPNQAEKLRNE